MASSVTLRPDTALDTPRPLAEDRSAWVRLRTLIVLRWLAIAGQITTIFVATQVLRLDLQIGLLYLAVGASVIANVISIFVYPENKRLAESEAMLTLLFDISQLAFLLYLTGGLNNPFALLILAPVTVSAATLRLRSTVFLGLCAVALISVVAVVNLPLVTAEGFILRMPDILVFGFWLAIVIGVAFLGAYAYRITGESHSMNEALLATQMALAREQKLTDLGGVVAAAAHELGTPLATIKLVSSELAEELDDPVLREDAILIRDQADRCRDILRSMGRAGKDDLHMRSAPLGAVVREAAEPHADRGVEVLYDFAADEGAPEGQPLIWRKPEVIHGLRNLVQNAVDFAEARIWVEGGWGDGTIRIRITDDGQGFPQDLLGRLGDPFLSRRARSQARERPGYEGMGLGLFIAKTLLERSGARVSFFNASDPFLVAEDKAEKSGAVVEVTWPHEALGLPAEEATGPLGENQPIAI